MKQYLVRFRNIKKRFSQLQRRLNRTPHLLFHAPGVALGKASRQPRCPIPQGQSIIHKIENKMIDGVAVYRDVISWPLKEGVTDQCSGGLLNGATHNLIDEAIHYRHGKPFQIAIGRGVPEGLRATIPEVKHPLLFGGILFNHFGHCLLEGLGRLWIYESIKELDPYIVFYTPWGIPDYLGRDNYVNQVFAGFKIPHDKLLFINDIAKLRTVIIPRQVYGFGYEDKPDSRFLDFVQKFKFRIDCPKGFEKAELIYVSRSKLAPGQRAIIGEELFEEFLISNGYTIFYPEKYTLYQQLTVYANAKKIIFSDGSALHACILLPNIRADIALYARCKGIGLYHEKQFRGYRKPVTGINAVKAEYVFGRDYWNILAEIDYYEVSVALKRAGFVRTLFEGYNQIDHSNLVRRALQYYLPTITQDLKYINFMMQHKGESVEWRAEL